HLCSTLARPPTSTLFPYTTLFRSAYRQAGGGGFQLPATATVGANPPNGAVIQYYLKAKPKDVTIEFLDASGKVVRKFSGRGAGEDRKSTRLNSSHDQISYAVFCLK